MIVLSISLPDVVAEDFAQDVGGMYVRSAVAEDAVEQVILLLPVPRVYGAESTIGAISVQRTIIGHLDGLAASLACPFLTEKDFRDMEFYIDSMDLAIRSQNYNMYLLQQKAFHQIYLDRCSNDSLIEYLTGLKNKFLKRSYTDDPLGSTAAILHKTNLQHREILQLLESGRSSEVSQYLADVHWAAENVHFDLMITDN